MQSVKEVLAWGDSLQARYAEGLALPTKGEVVSWLKEAVRHMDAQDICHLLGIADGIKHRNKKRR